jgi:hypothetical protein
MTRKPVTTGKYKINDKVILAPTALSFTYTRQAKSADRSDDGYYDEDRIADGVDLNLTFKPRSWSELAYMMTLLSEDQYIKFTYRSPKTATFITQTMYVGERDINVLQDVEDDTLSNFELTAHVVAKNSDRLE